MSGYNVLLGQLANPGGGRILFATLTYTTPGIYNWSPSVSGTGSVLAIGGGGAGPGYSSVSSSSSGGGGGGLVYKNNISITGGNTYAIVVGAGGTGGVPNSGGASVATAGGASFFADITGLTSTGTTATGNTITLSSSSALVIGYPIVFSGGNFGNMVSGNTYYILTKPSSTSITVANTYANYQSSTTMAQVTAAPMGASYYGIFTGSQYITAPRAAGALTTGTFTIEAWVYPTSFSNGPTIVGNVYWDGGYNGGWHMYFNTSGNIAVDLSNGTYNSIPTLLTSTIAVSLNTWTHVALVRNASNVVNLYINGVGLTSPPTNSASWSATSGGTQTYWLTAIGSHNVDGAWYNQFNGYISNVRIVPTVCVYTGTFSSPYPLSITQSSSTNIAAITGSQTGFLTLQDATIIDKSVTGWTITNSTTPVTTAVFTALQITAVSTTICFAGGGGAGSNGLVAGGAGGVSIGGTGGGAGGAGGTAVGGNGNSGAGGGGAGGYNGAGGAGGLANGTAGSNPAVGSGGGGGGVGKSGWSGGGGGGVGLLGVGSDGVGTGGGGTGGSGGSAGLDYWQTSQNSGGNGGAYGGGGGGTGYEYQSEIGGYGGSGAVRVIIGPSRAYPSPVTAVSI